MDDKAGSQQIDDIIELYDNWKGENIAHIRAIIKSAAPEAIEEVKWRMRTRPEGLPVWSQNGILCILETFKNDQKLVFFKGAQMKDPDNLFNARLKSATDRAIEFRAGDIVNEAGIESLVREAVQLNADKARKK